VLLAITDQMRSGYGDRQARHQHYLSFCESPGEDSGVVLRGSRFDGDEAPAAWRGGEHAESDVSLSTAEAHQLLPSVKQRVNSLIDSTITALDCARARWGCQLRPLR